MTNSLALPRIDDLEAEFNDGRAPAIKLAPRLTELLSYTPKDASDRTRALRLIERVQAALVAELEADAEKRSDPEKRDKLARNLVQALPYLPEGSELRARALRLVEPDLTNHFEALVDQRKDSKAMWALLRELWSRPPPVEQRAKVHRLSGVIRNRLKLDRDALGDLSEAKKLAMAARDYQELAKIGREAAVVCAWRGDDRSAACELLPALTFACLEGDNSEIAKIIAEYGRIEMEARRFDRVALVLRRFVVTSADRLPALEAHRMKINLCQALNQLGEFGDVLGIVAQLKERLPADPNRLQFLTRLEEVRALAGLRRFEKAEEALEAASTWLPKEEGAFERTEYLQAEMELKIAQGGEPTVEGLQELLDEFDEQTLVVRGAFARRAMANALFRIGKVEAARDVLAEALCKAINDSLDELANEIRADMLKFAGADQIEELTGVIDMIGGKRSLDRRFVLLGKLGEGGAGKVYSAIDLKSGERVALKILNLRVYSPDKRDFIINSIKMEYGVACRLNSTGLCEIQDLLIEPGGSIYVVQELINGRSLRAVYESDEPASRLLDLLANVAEAVRTLHLKGIVHRDLKPDNVMVCPDGSPVLIDFGIASLAGKPDRLAQFGTKPYVAPEAGGPTADYRADVYALGQMLAEIWGDGLPAFGLSFLGGGGKRGLMPRPIQRLARQMLAPDPERRLSDLKLIASDLRAHAQRMTQEPR